MLLVVLVVVVVLLAHACSGGSAKPAATPQPSATPSSAPSTAGPVTACRGSDLSVTASTDETTYPAGALPRLSAVVRNVSDQPCRLVTAPGRRVWTIVSGADQIWTSADCTVSGVKAQKRLRPDGTIAYGLVWNRRRSADGCPSDTPAAGPGTYQLEVSVNGVDAAKVVFHLTR